MKCKQHNGNSGCNRPTNECFYCWEAFIENHPQAYIGAKDLLNIMRGFKASLKDNSDTNTLKDTLPKSLPHNKNLNGHVEYLESVLTEKGTPGKSQQVEQQLIKSSSSGEK